MANFDFQDFLAEIRTEGLARANLFQVEILPGLDGTVVPLNKRYKDFLLGDVSERDISKKMTLMCQSVDFGGSLVSTYESPYAQFPYGRMYEPFSIEFKINKNVFQKKIIDMWSNYIIDPMSKYSAYYDDYKRNIIVSVLDNRMNLKYSILCYDCYPTTVTPSALSQDENDSFLRASVTFSYRKSEPYIGQDTNPSTQGVLDSYGESGQQIFEAIQSGKVGDLQAPIKNILNTTKGLLSLDQGETLNYYNKLSQISQDYLGVSIQGGRRFVESVKNDIDSITDTNIMDSTNQNVLSQSAGDILNILN